MTYFNRFEKMARRTRSIRNFPIVAIFVYVSSCNALNSTESLNQYSYPTSSFTEQLAVSSEPNVEVVNFADPKDLALKPILGGECVSKGHRYGGENEVIHVETASSWQMCQRFCEIQEGCSYFTLFGSLTSYNCFLYNSNATLQKLVDNQSTFSGPKRCNGDYSCIHDALDLPGHDIDHHYAADIFECHRSCLQHPDCEYYGFFTANKDCWRKRKAALTGWRYLNAGQVKTGPKNCVQNWCWLKEMALDTRGSNLVKKVQNVDSTAACQELCQQNGECTHWTYNTSRDCFLLKNLTGLRSAGDSISGAKYCGSILELTFDGNFSRNQYKMLKLRSDLECQKQCFQDPKCSYWVRNSADLYCYLFNQVAPEVIERAQNCKSGYAIPGITRRAK